jgi:hypothetical protein
VWWFALPGVALLGIAASVVAPRASRRHFYVLPALSCATFLVPYMVLSPENSQARFLMPAYALLMVPAAYFIVWAANPYPIPRAMGSRDRCERRLDFTRGRATGDT